MLVSCGVIGGGRRRGTYVKRNMDVMTPVLRPMRGTSREVSGFHRERLRAK